MNIVIVNQFALRPSDSGTTRHFSLAKALIAQGHSVSIIASNVHYLTRKQFAIPGALEEIENVRFLWLKTHPYSTNVKRLINHIEFALKCLTLSFKTDLTTADLIIGSSPQPFSAFVMFLYSKILRKKFAYEIRDLWPQTLIDLGATSRKSPISRLMYVIETILAKRSDVVITLLPRVDSYFKLRGITPRQIVWIPNGVDFSAISEDEAPELSKSNKMKILFFGSHGPADGIDFLLKVAKLMEKDAVEFIFVGDGSEKSNLIATAQKLELQNVRFLPSIKKKYAIKTLKQADLLTVLAIPSPLYKWGISFNKIYDYFAASKPILFIGDVACNPVEEANAGIVIPVFDATRTTDSIREFAKMSALEKQQMGQNGLNYVSRNNDYNLLGQKLSTCLSQICSK